MLLLGPSRRPVLANKGHGDIRVQAAAAGLVWAHGPAASGFYVDVRCHRGQYEPCVEACVEV